VAVKNITVWTVDFDTPVCTLYLLCISADAAQEKEKREEIAAAHWCFKVCSHTFYQPAITRRFEKCSAMKTTGCIFSFAGVTVLLSY
jgi:hypothetical protein